MSQLSVNLGLDIMPQSQDPDNQYDLFRLYNAVKILAFALDSYTGSLGAEVSEWSTVGASRIKTQNLSRLYVQFTETVSPGMIVTLYNNSGVLAAKKAGGSVWQGLANGFVLAGVNSGSFGEVFLSGVNSSLTGLTPGSTYYTSAATPGLISSGASSPNIQEVGIALSTSELWFNPIQYKR